jgi:CRISPR system Cascade subunit CasA
VPHHDRPSFNVLDEPFIPVLTTQGNTGTVSMIDFLTDAENIVRINGDLPTQSFSLMRLALAVLHRAFADRTPTSHDDISEVVDDLAAQWSTTACAQAVAYLERHRERFDLFHPTTPFYQVPGMRTARDEVTDLGRIVADVPVGNPFLTLRSRRNLRRVPAAEAARWLIHAQAYDPSGIKTGIVGHPRVKGGKVYPEGTAWAGQLGGTYLLGRTLLSTLLLNLWASRPDPELLDRDLPPWERPPQSVESAPDLAHRPYGPVDLYTWQPRRILLFHEPHGTDVTGVLLTYGDRFIIQERQHLIDIEPMTGWRYSKPQTTKYKRPTYMARRRPPGVALWRGMSTLLSASTHRSAEDPIPPGVLTHAADLDTSDLLADGLVHLASIDVTYGPQESVISEITEDTLDLPAQILDPALAELRLIAIDAVEAARDGASALSNLAANLAIASGGSRDDLDGPRDRAREQAYATLDPLYRQWLRDVLPGSAADPSVAEHAWHRDARHALVASGEAMIAQFPPTAWRGWGQSGSRIDVGKADVYFRRALAKAFPKAQLDLPPTSVEGAA